jgi:hypothetical protein
VALDAVICHALTFLSNGTLPMVKMKAADIRKHELVCKLANDESTDDGIEVVKDACPLFVFTFKDICLGHLIQLAMMTEALAPWHPHSAHRWRIERKSAFARQ